jgi:septum formation protein
LPLILASGSSIRRKMLEDAAVEHIPVGAGVDEAALKLGCTDPAEIALSLAEAKALAVSSLHPADWVIGSDSIVSVDGRLFDKPASRDEAAEHLRLFSGKSLILTSAVALARGGRIDWNHADRAKLNVRSLSAEFIKSYLEMEWPEVSHCVGVFRMEGPGAQLFERVEGSYFTILGMPLVPLLGALRERGILPS